MTQIVISNDNAKYDSRHDVLHVSLAPYRPYYGDEDYPGIVINRSMDDESAIGLTIFDFKKKGKERLVRELPEYDFSSALN
jgi:hypothetical protein